MTDDTDDLTDDDVDEDAVTGEFEPLPDDSGGEDDADEVPQMPSLLDDPDAEDADSEEE